MTDTERSPVTPTLEARLAEAALQMDDKARRRFMKFVSVSPDGCWYWTSALNNRGYGTFWLNGKTRFAHRVAFATYCRTLVSGETLDHLCRNPACVKPEHLEPVSMRENVLRGIAPTAINARKTECINGHDDWRATPRGRECRTCNTIRARRNYSPEKRKVRWANEKERHRRQAG